MVGLLGGKAEPLPQAPRPKAALAAPAPNRPRNKKPPPATSSHPSSSMASCRPTSPIRENQPAIAAAAKGERPQRPNQFLRDSIDALVNIYNAAGIHDYDWKVFGKDLRDAEWDYFSFDPPETQPKDNPTATAR